MTDPVEDALALWGFENAACDFVAGRENRVYRVFAPQGDFALRFKRPGYRDDVELLSELQWLDAMDHAGLSVPQPRAALSGKMLECVDGCRVDMVGWLPGRSLGQSRTPLDIPDPLGVFRRLGAEIARLHTACDSWQMPEGFTRCAWDADGLLGENPLWGRFWENPALDAGTQQLFETFRRQARQHLDSEADSLDYGLIHADLVRENVLLDGPAIRMIDFDDGGFGFRHFDIATALVKNRAELDYEDLKAALLEGYHSLRVLDDRTLDLFMALRAVTYVGWIAQRLGEPGSEARNKRFIDDARLLCAGYLGQPTIG